MRKEGKVLYEKNENVMLLLLCFLCLSGCNYKDDDQVKKICEKAWN